MTESENKIKITNNVNLLANLQPLKNMLIIAVVVIAVTLVIAIVLTVFAHKARMRCSKNVKYSYYATIILVFLLCLWLGGLVPYAGPLISTTGLIGSIVMLILAKKNC